MAKWCGVIGFGVNEETKPGVWKTSITEHTYYGDLIRDTRRYSTPSTLNDNLDISNQISILADAFAYDHFYTMRYVELYGARWKVTNVEVQRPRLILSIGGVYNGSSPGTSREAL